jgi:hypothetical protein
MQGLRHLTHHQPTLGKVRKLFATPHLSIFMVLHIHDLGLLARRLGFAHTRAFFFMTSCLYSYFRCIIRGNKHPMELFAWRIGEGELGFSSKIYTRVYGFMAFYIHYESISLKLCLEALGLSFCATWLWLKLLQLDSLLDRVSECESANCIFLSLTYSVLCMRCIA